MHRPRRRHLAGPILMAAMAAMAAAATAPPAAAEPTPLPADDVTTLTVPEGVAPGAAEGLFGQAPMLGPSGHLDWFASRQSAAADRRALGRLSAYGAAPTGLHLRSVRGTVAVRGFPGTAARTTTAVAYRGRNWVLDRVVSGGSERWVLRGLLDGSRSVRTVTFADGYQPAAAIPTDQGIRTFSDQYDPAGAPVTGPGQTTPVHPPGVTRIVSAAGLPEGRLMVAADVGAAPRALLIVDPDGAVHALADRADAGAPSFTGGAGIASTLGGIVVDEVGVISRPGAVDQGAVVLRDPQNGAVRLRRMLRDLEFPKNPRCVAAGSHFRATRVISGPDGLPVVTVVCGDRPEFVDPLTGTKSSAPIDVQAVTVGLSADFAVRWWRPAPEHPFVQRPTLEGADQGSLVPGAGNQLHAIAPDGTVRTFSSPSIGRPRTGSAGGRHRISRHSARVRIICRGTEGTICAGTAEIRVHGKTIGSAPYALPARPGAAQGELDRRVITHRAVPRHFNVRLRAHR